MASGKKPGDDKTGRLRKINLPDAMYFFFQDDCDVGAAGAAVAPEHNQPTPLKPPPKLRPGPGPPAAAQSGYKWLVERWSGQVCPPGCKVKIAG